MQAEARETGAPIGRAPSLPRPRYFTDVIDAVRRNGPAIAGYTIPFLLVLYLALKGGGYSQIIRGEIGLAVWWLVLLGALVGLLPVARIGTLGWLGLGVLLAFAAWTGFGIGWSESSERSVAELARVITYVGTFALALSVQGRDGLRRTVISVGIALAAVGVLAVASRLHPSWFPVNETAAALASTKGRLDYPVNYWNGLAALMAIGIPLLLCIAAESRLLLVRAFATALLPVMALAAFFTFSRGGAIEIALALVALIVLYPRRLTVLPTATLAGVGSALLIAAANQRDELIDGHTGHVAANQGDEMVAVVLIVCVGVGLLAGALGLASRYGIGPRFSVSRSATIATASIFVVLGLIVSIGAAVPGEISDRWQDFKNPRVETTGSSRFQSSSGNGRYQLWQAALDANASDPLIGIGPGTYEFWWARNGDLSGFVRDAHSLYLETLGELGIIGFVLILLVVLGLVAIGALRSFTTSLRARPWMAAATAGCVAFAAAAAFDWVWELAVVPIAFLLLAAGVLGERGPANEPSTESRRRTLMPRLVLGVLAVLALIGVAIPLAAASSVRASQDDVNNGDLAAALSAANRAAAVEPYASTPSLQQALVLELRGDLDAAAVAARAATREEPTNWRTWLVLSRIEAYRDDPRASLDAYREAKSLNPRSQLFANQ